MTMFESPGAWWLPERPANRVPGLLRIRDDGRVEVQLFGVLLDDRLDAHAEFEELHGTLHRSPLPGGTEVTHLRGFAIRRSFSSSGAASETLVANRSYVGDRHVQRTATFRSFTSRLHGLREWLPGSTISSAREGSEFRVTAGSPFEVSASLSGCTVTLRRSADVERSRGRVSISESADARVLLAKPASVDAFVEDWLVPLRIFLSLATGTVSFVQSLAVVLDPTSKWPDEVHDLELWAAGQAHGSPDVVTEPWIPGATTNQQLTSVLRRWWALRRRQRRAIERVFSLWDRPPDYIDLRFLAFSSSIDLLARARRRSPDAVATLFEELPREAVEALDAVRLLAQWRALRARVEDEGFAEATELLAVSGALKWVARFTLLAELGVPLDGALRSSEFRHDRSRLERALQASKGVEEARNASSSSFGSRRNRRA